jgi:FlaA1/EpsC-like NDP-sugar epimerase
MRKAIMPVIASLLALSMAVLLNRHDPSMKWNVPIFWTGVTFFTILELSRKQWREKAFWYLFGAVLSAHILIMWVLFSVAYPRVRIPMIMTIPLIIVETIVLLKVLSDKRKGYFSPEKQ